MDIAKPGEMLITRSLNAIPEFIAAYVLSSGILLNYSASLWGKLDGNRTTNLSRISPK